jgi:uncharacterized protein (DUF1919 family)
MYSKQPITLAVHFELEHSFTQCRQDAMVRWKRTSKKCLFIRTTGSKVHVRGSHAEQDATALEQLGVHVYRSPLDCS